MKARKNIILLLIILLCCQLHISAQHASETPVPYDEETYNESGTSAPNSGERKYERSYMDENQLEALRKRKEFQYPDIDSLAAADTLVFKRKPGEANTGTNRFKGFDANILLWLIVAIAVIVVILQLAGVNMRQLFAPSRLPRNNEESLLHENIHEIPYESAIREAISARNYSLATRLMYLQSLKLLSDRNLIIWHEHKTNWQYVHELKNEKLRNSFRDITYIFEYVHYGHMAITEEKFPAVEKAFSNFKQDVR